MNYSTRTLEEKKVALEKKLGRSLATRVVFSTEDSQFLVQVLREITFSIEVTTVTSLSVFKFYLMAEIPHGIPVRYDCKE